MSGVFSADEWCLIAQHLEWHQTLVNLMCTSEFVYNAVKKQWHKMKKEKYYDARMEVAMWNAQGGKFVGRTDGEMTEFYVRSGKHRMAGRLIGREWLKEPYEVKSVEWFMHVGDAFENKEIIRKLVDALDSLRKDATKSEKRIKMANK